jgi:hypothetical protein
MLMLYLRLRLMVFGVLAVVAGCSSEVSEKTLPGTWRASGDGTGMTLRIKSENPNAKPSEITAAAKILSATSLEVKHDATYSLTYGVNTFGGTWKFDKEAGLVELAVETQNGEAADPKNSMENGFLGIVNQKDGTMKLFNGDQKTYEELKKRGDKGADALNVRLRKA